MDIITSGIEATPSALCFSLIRATLALNEADLAPVILISIDE